MTATAQPPKLLVSTREAAAMLGISPRSLWTITQAGDIPSIRIGRSVRYSLDDIKAFIDSQRQAVAK